MGFWIFMLVMDLLIPVTMAGFGRAFLKKAPGQINYAFGYRTSMSMKNKDTWDYAHKFCGRLWYIAGLVLLPVTFIAMLFVLGKDEDTVGGLGGIISFIQMVPLIGSIIPTELALRKHFDKNGRRKDPGEAENAGKR